MAKVKQPVDLRKSIEELQSELDAMERFVTQGRSRLEVLLKESAGVADLEPIRAFIRKPWCVIPKGTSEYWLIVPSWSNVHAGWLHSSTSSHRIFIVDRYSQWFGSIPDQLRGDLDLENPLNAVVQNGVLKSDDATAKKLKAHLGITIKAGEQWKVKGGHEFDLLADLIEMGAMPFAPQPVEADDIRELSWTLRQATGVGKAPHVAGFIRLLAESDEKVLVYAWHRTVYDILMSKLKDLKPVMFTGSEPPAKKHASKSAFMSDESNIMLVSLRAGAGVDGLQKVCRTVVFAELDWSPGIHEQCTGRVFRDGQPDPVTAYFMLSDAGADPVIAERLGLKSEQVDGIRDPHLDPLEKLNSDAGRAKALAKHYLASLQKKRKRLLTQV